MRILSSLIALSLTHGVSCLTSSLVAVTDFVSSIEDVALYAYIPEVTVDNPAIVVALHSCERTAGYYFENTGYASLADDHGFIVLFPNSSVASGCWDTTSTASTTRDGGGDSQVIADMVAYAASTYNADASKVSVTGSSSGGVMVNLLAGLYPDVFQAGSVYSGSYTNNIYSYTGSRPKMMIWHGTADEIYPYAELGDELAEWSKVLDVTFTQNISNTPNGGYTRMEYGDGTKLIGISAAGVGHTVPVDAASDLEWFCVYPECVTSASSSTVLTSTSTSASPSTSTSASGQTASVSSADVASASETGSALLSTSTTTGDAPSAETSTASSAAVVTASTPTTSKLSSGAKAGISVGVIGAVVLVFAVLAWWFRRRRQNRSTEPDAEKPMKSGPAGILGRHPSYTAAPTHDITQPAASTEKKHRRSARSIDGLLSFVQKKPDKKSSPSTLSPPDFSPDEARFSTASLRTMLASYASGKEHRQSTSSTLFSSLAPDKDKRVSTSSML